MRSRRDETGFLGFPVGMMKDFVRGTYVTRAGWILPCLPYLLTYLPYFQGFRALWLGLWLCSLEARINVF